MPLSNITSSDIPTIVRGASAARDGLPFDPNETEIWKTAYRLHSEFSYPVDAGSLVLPPEQTKGQR
ncbi:MAG: hypothetical protein HOO99_04035 [Hyphomicrobiaceae bacterium]|nr:hypothetical protein [Hyphomicrobiaceae bacterium]